MKNILILLLFVTSLASGQDVIDFKLLANKQVKSTANYTVSDNTLDFKNIDHQGVYYVRFIGEYPKRLVIKNLIGGDVILEGSIKTATDNKSFQLMDCKRITLDLIGAINGSGYGGTCGQLIYFSGKWQNVIIKGGRLHQSGSSGGAALQFESVSDINFNHGKVVIDGLIVTGAMGEGLYMGYNQPTKSYLDTLIVRNTNISNTRRDFWQQANVNYTLYENNIGTNGGLEMNTDHVSGFSLNGKNDVVIIRKNNVSSIGQFIYSSTASKIQLDSNVYTQGNHVGVRMNQAIYTKSAMKLQSNVINAPAAKEAAITADGCQVEVMAPNNIVATKLYRTFNGGSVIQTIPPPTVKEFIDDLSVTETTTYEGVKTYRYVYKGVELVPKQ